MEVVNRPLETKTELLNELFDKWQKSVEEYKGHFIKDGIVDESKYNKASTKILFIAKEPNNPNQDEWDFRKWWQQPIKYTFSKRIADWSYGILNNFPQYDEIRKNEENTLEAIRSISFMNIKKSGGGGNSEYNRIAEHLEKNFELLHNQIDIISPDIIITGTSWKELRHGLFPNVKWINSGYDIAIGKHKNSKVIDFYHPSSRNAPSAAYSLLQNVINSEQFRQL